MLKPSGLLAYSVTIPGGPGTLAVDVVADDDDAGNHFDPTKMAPSADVFNAMAGWFSPDGVGASGDASKVYLARVMNTGGSGEITSFAWELTNNSAAAGDTVFGRLYVLLPQAGNYGV